MIPLETLLDSIFDGTRPAFYAEFEGWVRSSRRFRAFATSHQVKIRAKLRHAHSDEGLQDLRAELAAAELLLRDDWFALEYEKYAAAKQRGPDFTVTFRTHTPFNVEVRRLRGMELGKGADTQVAKLTAVLCDKVGQMPPSIVNLLWLSSERAIGDDALLNAVTTLRQLAERKAEDYFTRRGFNSAASFLKQSRHLSGIVLWQPGAQTVWLNPIAQHPVPPEVVRAIERLEAR